MKTRPLKEDEFPAGFAEAFQAHSGHIVTKLDHFGMLFNCWMLDVGFSTDESLNGNPLQMQSSSAGLKFNYNFAESPGRCVLQMVPIGQSVVVKGIYTGDPSAAVSMPTLHLSKHLGDLKNDNVLARYVNIKELAQQFKNGIAWPLLRHVKDVLGIPLGIESIACLPNELIPILASHIDQPIDLLRFGATCQSYNLIANKNVYWKRFFKR